ncbi:UDP-N-acetylglucosamine 1-carboxyvinyltransferase [Intrasporangium chromatireducens Q5-1]|uniref:UDP-N-acetylglucosamine 1-carboxyvinyltransferase n=1 Tax=Intrasporangium chromatireducens Q5-1 TaxID=584657 RepID=W9GNW8_9MICO|nr:UDP-N-acetylglucosamine 1-carboxyvinyltransferase [Intrasporangium chromatireducens]EWT05564.1 UDP-N-acetylglucosamine 1-carboxyvinyltransferase [Intrasporangium chromatireducens Q5-1]
MRERFRICGGARLVGEVDVVGAKNSALKLMAAALLAHGRTTLTNVPAIADVTIMAQLLRSLGVEVDYDAVTGVVVLDVPETVGHRADYRLVRALRASISVLGPLVARTGAADVAVPGGDAIGSRGLDLHAAGLEALGASVHVSHGYLVATAPHGLTGTEIRLEFPSVGATENILTAAVLARGRTIIDNAAREPEIGDLADLLTEMGAQVSGAGTSCIVVEGVDALKPTTHAVVPDRIAAGTWAFAAATTRGDIEIVGGRTDHLRAPLAALERAGCRIETTARGFRVAAGPERPTAFDVATLPYPGFPTDLQPFAIAYNAVASGSAMVTENLFEARFRTVQELARLGADAQVDGHHVMVHGVPILSGAPVQSSDIRSGAALVIAGLVAEGETLVSGVHHIDRGYPRFEEALCRLGADVTREPDEDLWED